MDFYEKLIDKIDFSDFVDESCLKPSDLIRNAESDPEVSCKVGQLIPYISKNLNEKTAEENLSLFSSCESLILHIASIGNPEYILIDFIEEGEGGDSVKFQVILKCWQICLKRYPILGSNQLEWCLNTVIRYLNDVDLPADLNLEGKEKALFDSDPLVRSFIGLYEEILTFSEFVLEDLTEKFAEDPNYKKIMVKYLLKLLGKPMAWMDLEDNESKSTLKSISEQIIHLICQFSNDILCFIANIDFDDDEETDDVAEQSFTGLSLSVFYYLIFAENVKRNSIPQVYSKLYVFNQLIKCALVLLKMSENLVQRKGVLLVNSALLLIEDNSLVAKGLHHQELLETLPAIMLYSNNKEVRQDALKAFKIYLNKVTVEMRYTIFLNVQDIVNQAGFIGYLATLMKDNVAAVLNGDIQDVHNFTGKRLSDLVKRFAKLDDGEKTDLVEKSDTLISVLNFLRFIYIRDKEDKTGLASIALWLKENYIDLIIRGVQISIAHYNLEMKKTSDDPVPSVTVANDLKAELSPQDKSAIAANAINTLDLINSLAVRVKECLPLKNVI